LASNTLRAVARCAAWGSGPPRGGGGAASCSESSLACGRGGSARRSSDWISSGEVMGGSSSRVTTGLSGAPASPSIRSSPALPFARALLGLLLRPFGLLERVEQQAHVASWAAPSAGG
jgi:hypothetical protein